MQAPIYSVIHACITGHCASTVQARTHVPYLHLGPPTQTVGDTYTSSRQPPVPASLTCPLAAGPCCCRPQTALKPTPACSQALPSPPAQGQALAARLLPCTPRQPHLRSSSSTRTWPREPSSPCTPSEVVAGKRSNNGASRVTGQRRREEIADRKGGKQIVHNITIGR